jgi:hypothetical protein
LIFGKIPAKQYKQQCGPSNDTVSLPNASASADINITIQSSIRHFASFFYGAMGLPAKHSRNFIGTGVAPGYHSIYFSDRQVP